MSAGAESARLTTASARRSSHRRERRQLGVVERVEDPISLGDVEIGLLRRDRPKPALIKPRDSPALASSSTLVPLGGSSDQGRFACVRSSSATARAGGEASCTFVVDLGRPPKPPEKVKRNPLPEPANPRASAIVSTRWPIALSPSSRSSRSTQPGGVEIPIFGLPTSASSSPPATTSATDRSLRAYSTIGTRGDVDIVLLSQSPNLDDLHTFHVVLGQSGLAKWAETPYSFLSMTKKSPYSEEGARPEICISERKYLFLYPMVKQRRWYGLPPRSGCGS